MPSLFVSYRRSDSPDAVKLIVERLKQRLPRWEVFYDHESIRPGEEFPELLRSKVSSATAVLVIIGPKWLDILRQRQFEPIDHVRTEVRLALESAANVIPLLVTNTVMPADTHLADFPDLQLLPKLNARPVRPDPDFDGDLERIITQLESFGPGESIGTTLSGKYTLVSAIGEGGMGVVYLAQQKQPVKRVVAVKLIKPGMDSREVLARFDAERQALAVMDHPNISKVLDAGVAANGRPFFVMEYVKGVPITQYCDDKKLTPQERLTLFIPVCHAVQHAHQKGIIHRDLKPTNVLVEVLDGKPVPKVIDFGLAKALGQKLTEKTLHTALDTRVGTLEYSAPEQAAGRSFEVDTRSDIYSLGVVLYELLTGAPPFTHEALLKIGEEEMRRMIREVEPTTPSKKLSSSGALPAIAALRHVEPNRLTRLVQGDLDWIVMKCLEKEQARRYETANQLGDELRRFLADQPVLAGPPSARYRMKKFLRRNKGSVIAASLVVLALVAGIIGTSIGLVMARQAAILEKAATEKERKSRIDAQESEAHARANLYRALVGEARALMQGRDTGWWWKGMDNIRQAAALDVSNRDPTELRELAIQCMGTQYPCLRLQGTWEGHTRPITSTSFSPDGRMVASGSRDQTVRLWSVPDGRPLAVLSEHADKEVTAVLFHPGGKWLAAGYADGRVRLWELAYPPQRALVPGGNTEQAAFVGNQRLLANDVVLHDFSRGWNGPSNSFCPGAIRALDVHPAGRWFAVGDQNGSLAIGDLQQSRNAIACSGHRQAIAALACSADGKSFASASADGTVKLWSWETGDCQRTLEPGLGPLHGLAWSKDNSVLALTGERGVAVCDLQSQGQVRMIRQHSLRSSVVALFADLLAFSGPDDTVEICQLRTGRTLHILQGHKRPVGALAFSPDGKLLASSAVNDTIRLWDATKDFVLREEISSGKWSWRALTPWLAFEAQGRYLAAGTMGPSLIWDLRSQPAAPAAQIGGEMCGRFTVDGSALLTGNFYGSVKQWTAVAIEQARAHAQGKSKVPLATFVDVGVDSPPTALIEGGHSDTIWSLAASADGRWLATAGFDQTVKLWDAQDRKLVRTLRGHRSSVFRVAFSPDAKYLASGAEGPSDTSIKVWEVATGRQFRLFTSHEKRVEGLAFHPSQPWLASSSDDGSVILWDFEAGKILGVLHRFQQAVHDLAFHPNGRWLAAACEDHSIALWELPERPGAPQHPVLLEGHSSAVWSVGFSKDGRYLASGAREGVIILWDGGKFTRLTTLRSDTREIRSISFSGDGQLLAGGAYVSPTIVWDLSLVRRTLADMNLDW